MYIVHILIPLWKDSYPMKITCPLNRVITVRRKLWNVHRPYRRISLFKFKCVIDIYAPVFNSRLVDQLLFVPSLKIRYKIKP